MEQFINKIITIGYWQSILDHYSNLGLVTPIILSMIESFFPPLPLMGVLMLNIAGHGILFGALFTWIGTCLGCTVVFLFMRYVIKKKLSWILNKFPMMHRAILWVDNITISTLFVIAALPATPASFLNIIFGLSDYDKKKYLLTMYCSKTIMIGIITAIESGLITWGTNPLFFILFIMIAIGISIISKRIIAKHGITKQSTQLFSQSMDIVTDNLEKGKENKNE